MLPPDTTLASGIHDMEQTLLTCRRTRSAIMRYQSVRETIQGVYQNGMEMFSAAFCASRLNGEILVRKAVDLRREKHHAKRAWDSLALKLSRVKEELTTQEGELKHLIQNQDQAREQLEKCRQAYGTAMEIAACQKDLVARESTEQKAREAYQMLKAADDQTRAQERQANRRRDEFSRELADSSHAWETLSRQVGLFRQATELLEEARGMLETDHLNRDNTGEWLRQVKNSLEESRETTQRAFEQWNEARLRHEHFAQYWEILKEATGDSIEAEDAGKRAQDEINAFFEMETLLRNGASVSERLAVVTEKIAKRRELQAKLAHVGVSGIATAADLETAWQNSVDGGRDLEAQRRELQTLILQKNQEIEHIGRRLPEITNELRSWELFHEHKKKLEDRTAQTIQNATELTHLRGQLEETLKKANLEQYRLENKRKEVQVVYNTLLHEGSVVPGLKSLAREGYGKLLADRYEDIPQEWAANLESRLGPLANALLVNNIHSAVDELSGNFDRPDDLWLLEDTGMDVLPEAREVGIRSWYAMETRGD